VFVYIPLHILTYRIFTILLGNGNCIVSVLKLSNSLDNFQIFSGKLWGINMIYIDCMEMEKIVHEKHRNSLLKTSE